MLSNLALFKSSKTQIVLRLFSLNNRICGTKKILQTLKDKSNHSGIKECMFIFGDIKTSWCYGQSSTGSKHYGRNRAAMALSLSGDSSLQQRKGMHCEFNNSWVILKKQSQPKWTTSGFLFLSVENPLLCVRALINFNPNIGKGS